MTFAEYNTDENFNKPSNAMELVRLGKSEGKTRDEIANSLSPLWKEDKKGNVKKALDHYFKEEDKTPSFTPKKTEEKPDIKKRDEEFLNKTNVIADTQQKTELDKLEKEKEDSYNKTFDTMKRNGEMFGTIDDKMVSNLPTFMFRRFQNGDFGDPKSTDAKSRLAYFMINGIGTALQNASASIKGGQMQDSDYETYKKTNLAQGLENRWNKYKQETQSAIDLVKNRGMTEEEAYDTVRTISRNQRLQTAFNMMNEKQKVYLMNVTKEIGDQIGSFDNEELINFLTGAAVSGDKLTWQEAAAIAVAKFGPTAYKELKDGKGRIEGEDKTAGLGGSGNKTKLSDGTVINPGLTMNDAELKQIQDKANELSQKYFNGEITEEELRNDYGKLEAVMKNHPIKNAKDGGIVSVDNLIKQNNANKLNDLSMSFEELNTNAKNMSKSDYEEQYADLKANALKWGATDKMLKSMEKAKDKVLKSFN